MSAFNERNRPVKALLPPGKQNANILPLLLSNSYQV